MGSKSLQSAQGLTIYREDSASSGKHDDSTGLISLSCTSLCDPRAPAGNLLKEFLIIEKKLTFHLVKLKPSLGFCWPGIYKEALQLGWQLLGLTLLRYPHVGVPGAPVWVSPTQLSRA